MVGDKACPGQEEPQSGVDVHGVEVKGRAKAEPRQIYSSGYLEAGAMICLGFIWAGDWVRRSGGAWGTPGRPEDP